MRFPLRAGSSYEQFRKNNLDSGSDLDEDGVNERVNIVAIVSVAGVDDPVTVPSGTYENVIKVETKLTFTFRSTAFGDTVTVYGTDTNWLAPGVGSIKFSYEITSPEDGESQIETWVLTPKQDVGPEPPPVERVEIVAESLTLPVGGTRVLTARAFDKQGAMIFGFPIEWSSSNNAVVSVEGQGAGEGSRVLRGVSMGSATITATLGGVSSKPVPVTVAEIRILSLATNDLIYDAGTGMIFASVPSRAGTFGNSIVPIDPELGTTGAAVPIGSEPNKLARSDDGKLLYVGLDGAGAIRQFSVETQTSGYQFSLGSDPSRGRILASDIAVLPGASSSVAVARGFENVWPGSAGVAVYDSGVKRPIEIPEFLTSSVKTRALAFSASPTVLYGSDGDYFGSGGSTFARMAIDNSGISLTDTTYGIVGGPVIAFAADRIYSANGSVFNPATLQGAGTFRLLGPYSGTGVVPDSTRNRAYFLEWGQLENAWVIEIFNDQTFTPIGSISIPDVPTTFVQCGDLVRWGTNGLAFRCANVSFGASAQDYVVLIRSHLVN
jgi:hypothetical protein